MEELLLSVPPQPVVGDLSDSADKSPSQTKCLRGFRARWTKSSSTNVNSGNPMDRSQDLSGVHVQETDRHELVDEAMHNIEQVARIESMTRFRNHGIKMPWELGPLAPIFAEGPVTGILGLPAMPSVGLVDHIAPPQVVQTSTVVPLDRPSKFAQQRIQKAKLSIPEDELRTRALNQIKTILLIDLEATETGCTLASVAGVIDEQSNFLQVLSDTFAIKATATIVKRTSAWWRFAKWTAAFKDTSCLEVNEALVYDYVCHLRDTQMAPSAASHFVESLRFFDAQLRFRRFSTKVVLSNRVTGAAHSMFLKKRKLVQTPQLTVDAVAALERACLFSDDPVHTIMAGALLFCVFACARWSDCSRVESCWADQHKDFVLLEAESSKHKTSRSKEAQTRMFPYTAIGVFLEDEPWAAKFLEARESLDLPPGAPFIPSYNDRAGTWASSPMSSAEATCFLRELLEIELGTKEAAKFSSHSCKATILTWAAMTDIFTREERTQLGHHAEAGTRSALVYSRDSQVLLQSKVARLLDLIRQGKLCPDDTRATRLYAMLDDQHQATNEEDAMSEESDIHDVPQEEEVHQLAKKVHMNRDPVPLGDPDEFTFLTHRFTGTIHVLKDAEAGKLACGRAVTINMTEIDPTDIDSRTALFCIQCNQVIKR